MDYRAIGFCTITALIIFSGQSVVFGQNLNLSGNLNVNDTQITSTSNLLLSLLVSLAESIIPIVVGAVAGHKSMTYWQEKKDRIATKNNMLANYAQSFKIHGPLLDDFAHKVFKSYVVFAEDKGTCAISLNEYSNTDDKVSGFLKFPLDANELPSKKFHEEYGRLEDKINEISQARERLYLDLKCLHKSGADIIEKLQNIKNLLKRSEILLDKFIKSTDSENFMNGYSNYRVSSNKIKNEIEKLEFNMVRFSLGKSIS